MFHIKNIKKTQLIFNKMYPIQHRTLFKACANTANKVYLSKSVLGASATSSLRKPYATHHVHTPKPGTNTTEGLVNNPIVNLNRNTCTIQIHHPEVVQLCIKTNCENVVCSKLCDEAHGPLTSVATLSHSDVHGGIAISTEDIDGNKNRIQYYKPYEKPHETSKESADATKDKLRTENLQKMYFEDE